MFTKQIKRSLIQQVKLYFRNNSLPLLDDKKKPLILLLMIIH